ncbi:MAG: hypothetical protein JWM38_2478 [Sphingomonas bacterium]|nr:hypothetical protein [Sphingomonas bacterium]
MRRSAALVAMLGLATSGGVAHAQNAGRGATVEERERRNLGNVGARIGSFVLEPTVSIDARYDDNIYATASDRRGDVYLALRPEVHLRSDFVRHALDARAYYQRTLHAKYEGEDVAQYGASVDGRYDLAAYTRLSGRIAIDHAAESRGNLGTFRETSSPAEYDRIEGQGTVAQEFGPLAVAATGRLRSLTYSDALLGGVTIDQTYRDQKISDATIEASYAVHELTRFLIAGTVERRRFVLRPGDPGFDPVTSIDRSANGYRIEAGVQREVTALITGTVRIGYLSYNYPDPKLRDVSGFSYLADLRWNVTGLTTVTASASRRLDETTSPVTAGNLRDELALGVDHELLRTLLLSADIRYAAVKPSAVLADSREFEAAVGARYYIGRHVRAQAELRHSQRSSVDRSIAFKSNSFLVGVRFTL